ncbi:MAG: hypothetical protein ACT4QA_19540 [Panacagrimonas sp.]
MAGADVHARDMPEGFPRNCTDPERRWPEGFAPVYRKAVRNNPYSPGLQRYMRDAVRMLQAATDRRGNVGEALFWFRGSPFA